MYPIFYFLVIGLAAGYIAQKITPQEEQGGWKSYLVVGILGSLVGSILPFEWLIGDGFLARIIAATVGSLIVLVIYHKFFAGKTKLKP